MLELRTTRTPESRMSSPTQGRQTKVKSLFQGLSDFQRVDEIARLATFNPTWKRG
jgi:hypothetical protein